MSELDSNLGRATVKYSTFKGSQNPVMCDVFSGGMPVRISLKHHGLTSAHEDAEGTARLNHQSSLHHRFYRRALFCQLLTLPA